MLYGRHTVPQKTRLVNSEDVRLPPARCGTRGRDSLRIPPLPMRVRSPSFRDLEQRSGFILQAGVLACEGSSPFAALASTERLVIVWDPSSVDPLSLSLASYFHRF